MEDKETITVFCQKDEKALTVSLSSLKGLGQFLTRIAEGGFKETAENLLVTQFSTTAFSLVLQVFSGTVSLPQLATKLQTETLLEVCEALDHYGYPPQQLQKGLGDLEKKWTRDTKDDYALAELLVRFSEKGIQLVVASWAVYRYGYINYLEEAVKVRNHFLHIFSFD